MIETIETGSPKVVGFRLCGKLHDEDYRQFVPSGTRCGNSTNCMAQEGREEILRHTRP